MARRTSHGRFHRGDKRSTVRDRRRTRDGTSFLYRQLRFESLEGRFLLASDFGDAPNPYPTLLVNNGARHEAIGPTLGAARDTEADGQSSGGAVGDDNLGIDDEDGVNFNVIQVGQDATAAVTVHDAPTGAKFDAWIDFNGDGSWDSASEQIAASASVHEGPNVVSFSVPINASPGLKYTRVRLSTAGGLSPSGAAADGEVEDYSVDIVPADPTFGLFGHEHVTVPKYNDATTVTGADLDADGDVDLVSASRGDAILWSVNDGQGNFVTQTLASGVGKTWKVRAADVDRDGDLDIISAGEGTHAVAWYENLGVGLFQTHTVETTVTSNYDVWASDLDSDGDVDLLASGEAGFAWHENDGTQHFTMQSVDSQAFDVSAVRAVDLDHDGDMDIVESQYYSPSLSWYENSGADNFTRHLIVTTSNLYIKDVQVGDVDGDGDFDIVAGFTGETTNRVRWYRNNGSGTFQENAIFTSSNRVENIELADIDGDADTDIIAGSDWSTAGSVFWYKNNGLGAFNSTKILGAENVVQVIPADIDGDGDLDLVSTISDSNSGVFTEDRLSWYENSDQLVTLSSTGPFPLQESSSPNITFSYRRSGNTSVPLTVQFAVEGTANFGTDFVQAGAATFNAVNGSVIIPAGATTAQIVVTVHDDTQFEPDETIGLRPLELNTYALTAEAVSPYTWLIIDNDPGDYGDAPAPYPTFEDQNGPRHGATGPQLGTTRDAELNGQPTAAANGDDEPADQTGGIAFGTVQVGQQNATVAVNVQNASSGARLDVWLDFDRDGSWDGSAEHILTSVLVHAGINQFTFDVPSSAQSGLTYARFRLSTAGGLGTVGEAVDGEVEDVTLTVEPPKGSSGKFAFGGEIPGLDTLWDVDSGDLDGDGDVDLIFATNSGVSWVENVAGNFTTMPPRSVDPLAKQISVGDIDNDGDLDLLTLNQDSGRRTYWYRNDGAGSFTGFVVGPADAPYYVLHTTELADLDRDGDLDLVGSYLSYFAWLENTGSGQFAVRTSGSPDRGATGKPVDLDRDGDIDFVAPGTNTWYENTGALNFTKRTFPATSDTILARYVVDLDHDGFLDIVGTAGYQNKLAWQRNNGNRTFTPHYTNYYIDLQLTTAGTAALTAGDVDGDGFIDIVSIHTPEYSEDRGGLWFKNDGAGNFAPRAFFTNAERYIIQAAGVADLDNDGDSDFFGTTSWFGGHFSATWYRNVSTSVSVTVSPQVVPESGTQGLTYTFHRDDSVAELLTATFGVAGSAAFGTDYEQTGAANFSSTSGTIIFPVGVSTVQLTIAPAGDSLSEPSETVILTLADGGDYVPVGSGMATGTIADDEPGDFGDAPGPYPTTLAVNGARHIATGPRLGPLRDEEANGQPVAGALGDDTAGLSDEDGVQFGIVRAGQMDAAIVVHVEAATAGAFLDAWIDFDGDGSWGGALEAIGQSLILHEGDNVITFDVPSSASAGTTYARFRLSSAGGLSPYGIAVDGEVEDYAVMIDAPRPTSAAFAARQTVVAGASADNVLAGDLDSDGDTDLVGITASIARLSWYENNGQGEFTEHRLDSASPGSYLLLVDLDGDRDLDIVAIIGNYTIRKYSNDGNGNFAVSIVDYAASIGLRAIAAGDLDGDADMDLLVGGGTGGGNLVEWLETKDPSGYVKHFIADKTGNIKSLDVADLDGDGDLDLVSASSLWDQGVNWYENDGHARFSYHTLPAMNYPTFVKTADIDGDGDIDILASGSGLWSYVNNGSGAFRLRTIPYGQANTITCADLDGDGDVDLLTSTGSGPGSLRRYLNDGTGLFSQQTIDSGSMIGYGTGVADVNGDGALDLLSAGSLAWYRNLAPVTGDFNQDQVVDSGDYVLWRDAQGSNVNKFSGADANGDGVVGSEDYDAWRAHFGQTSASLSSASGATAVAAAVESATFNTSGIRRTDESPYLDGSTGATKQSTGDPNAAATRVRASVELAISLFGARDKQRDTGLEPGVSQEVQTQNSGVVSFRDVAIMAWLTQRANEAPDFKRSNDVPIRGRDSADAWSESVAIAWDEVEACGGFSRVDLSARSNSFSRIANK